MVESFKDFFQLNEAKGPNFCYMVFVESPYDQQLYDVQQSLNIDAEEPVSPDNFHCTVRYCKMLDGQTPDAFINWLSRQQFPELVGFTEKFTQFDEGSLVMELDSPSLHEWFNKIEHWLTTEGGYPPSEYPRYRPHVSLSYKTRSPIPRFDIRKNRLRLPFTVHRVTDHNKQVIYERYFPKNKNMNYG
jgi:2'-5' RNA ligase